MTHINLTVKSRYTHNEQTSPRKAKFGASDIIIENCYTHPINALLSDCRARVHLLSRRNFRQISNMPLPAPRVLSSLPGRKSRHVRACITRVPWLQADNRRPPLKRCTLALFAGYFGSWSFLVVFSKFNGEADTHVVRWRGGLTFDYSAYRTS